MKNATRKVCIVGAARTAIGTFGGSLSTVPPSDLASHVIRTAMVRADLNPADIGHVVMGNVIHTEPRDMYLSRAAAIEAGVPEAAPALTLNRLCGSGLQAIISAAQTILLRDTEVAVAGGAESMSRAPHLLAAVRYGQKMGDVSATDMLIGALSDPFGHGHMGVTAENVAADAGIDRERQDAFALESHRKAAAAIASGRFKDEIAPFEIAQRKGTQVFDTDEHVRTNVTAEDLAKLRPVFRKDGTVTAGNASGINDGAAAIALADRAFAEANDLPILAEVIGYAHAGVDPSRMGIGPVPAVSALLKKTGKSINDFDIIESNEAFASQACAVSDSLGFAQDRVNPNGGAIALGHPIGATGAILVVKAAHALQQRGGGEALITMCIGGGQGIALALRS